MSPTFTVQTLGEPCVFAEDGSRLEGLVRQRKRFALFLFLACGDHRGVSRRDHLLVLFWPDSDEHSARNSLRQAIHVLRAELGSAVIESHGESDVIADRRALRCDTLLFLRALASGQNEQALSLYQGDFLSGFHVDGAPEFNLWADQVRARLQRLAVRAAKNLAHTAEGQRSLADAQLWWRRVLELDPFDEAVLRRLMTLLAASGNRCSALAEFARFRSLVAAQLDATPSDRTVELAGIIARSPAEQLPMWVGDRRTSSIPADRGHRRRVTDLPPP